MRRILGKSRITKEMTGELAYNRLEFILRHIELHIVQKGSCHHYVVLSTRSPRVKGQLSRIIWVILHEPHVAVMAKETIAITFDFC